LHKKSDSLGNYLLCENSALPARNNWKYFLLFLNFLCKLLIILFFGGKNEEIFYRTVCAVTFDGVCNM
jgi:hypothetical protein